MKKDTIQTCNNCPNRFECNLMSYSLAVRKWACPMLSSSNPSLITYSENQPQLIIPEGRQDWERRLLNYQVYGTWVWQGERVGRIDSFADLSTFKICKPSTLFKYAQDKSIIDKEN